MHKKGDLVWGLNTVREMMSLSLLSIDLFLSNPESPTSHYNLSDQMVDSIASDQVRKRLVLQLPGNAYYHGNTFPICEILIGLREGERDSWLELKDNQSDNEAAELERRRRVGAVHIMQIQDEIDYILSNLEHMVEPHVALTRYSKHRKVLIGFLFVNMLFDIALNIYILININYILASLAETYKDYSYQKLEATFLGGSIFDLCLNIAMYYKGFVALKSHKVTDFNQYMWILLGTIFSRIIIGYFNILHLVMFVMKVILYLYSRLVQSMLMVILLLPPPALGLQINN